MDNWTIDFSSQEAADIFNDYHGMWISKEECEEEYTERDLRKVILELLGVEEDHKEDQL